MTGFFRLYLSVLYLLFSLEVSLAQSADSKYTAISKGDKIPNLLFHKMLNYSSETATSADFKGKLLIIDFWNSHCAACISSWPHLIEIQKKFQGKIQILLDNPDENESMVKNALEKGKKNLGIKIDLPTEYGDTLINKLFPYSGVPHIVWIDKDGVYKYATYDNSVNEKNIQAIIDGKNPEILEKIDNDSLISVDWDRPIFSPTNAGTPKKLLWQSTFAKGSERIWPGVYLRSIPKLNYFAIGGSASIKDLYRVAYSNRYSIDPTADTLLQLEPLMGNRVFLDVTDSTNYVDVIDHEYNYYKHYVYQLIPPGARSINELQQSMIQDLNRYVGLKANWEKRKVKCLILTCSDTSNISYRDGAFFRSISIDQFKANKASIRYLIYTLEQTIPGLLPYPLIDETHYKGLVGNIYIEANINDYKIFDKALQRYKLSLKLGDRLIDVLVISEPTGYRFPY